MWVSPEFVFTLLKASNQQLSVGPPSSQATHSLNALNALIPLKMALTLKSLQETAPFWVFHADVGPCEFCDPAMSMDTDGFWRCAHAQRLVVDEVPVVGRPHDGRVCPGNCAQHPLVDASGPLRLFMNAALTGGWWGDVMSALEEAAREAETPAQKAAREAREAAEKAEAQKASEAKMVSYHIEKCASVYCDRSGALKKTVLRMCKWDDHPAENGYPAGCAAHHKGACPWVHKDQPELMRELNAGKAAAVAKTGGRDFSALLGRPASGGSSSSSSSASSSSTGGRVTYYSARSSAAAGGGGGRGAGSGGSRPSSGGKAWPSGGHDGSAW